MEQDEIALEDGELSNDSDEQYTPLERPLNYSSTQPIPRLPVKDTLLSETDEELESNDSDSDSDSNAKKVKKPKIRLKPLPQQRNKKTAKKYDIWSTRLQEDSLAATLNNKCDVVKQDRSRDVESYDYNLAQKYFNSGLGNRFSQPERIGNKRTIDDRNNKDFRQRQQSPNSEREEKGEPREIADLTVDKNGEAEDIANEIANKLCEEKVDLVMRVIKVLGKEKAIEIFQETKELEAEGGMLIMNRTRRRTPGGVYFHLVRHDYHITYDQRNEIFGEERRQIKKIVKEKQKEKAEQAKRKVAVARQKMLPELLTKAELLEVQNLTKKLKERVAERTEQEVCVNPPPTPETDGYENSRDGMDGSPFLLDGGRGVINYEDDLIDLRCGDDMDLF
ncbi:unnamed protein product [Phyllotreta striolata]|uniref:Phosphorylated adapter RNA export protein n=1 Tax=Phyllotreta striolata TaxID=444603 RepID=A0A9N9XLT0_PHYSR|nr:unnamed protein product [Phyllotreta striolata]